MILSLKIFEDSFIIKKIIILFKSIFEILKLKKNCSVLFKSTLDWWFSI